MNTSATAGHGQIDWNSVLIYVSGPGQVPLWSPRYLPYLHSRVTEGLLLAAAAGPNAELIGFLSPVGAGTRHHSGHQGRASAFCLAPDCRKIVRGVCFAGYFLVPHSKVPPQIQVSPHIDVLYGSPLQTRGLSSPALGKQSRIRIMPIKTVELWCLHTVLYCGFISQICR